MIYNSIRSYFKTEGSVQALEFGPGGEFNGTQNSDGVYRAQLRKQLRDSYELLIEQYGGNHGVIDKFKLTNQSVLTWDDYWIGQDDLIIDPLIRHMNLQRNNLVYVNMSTPRVALESLNLEGNANLKHLYIHEAKNLKELNISGCTSLSYVSLGLNKSIQTLIAKDCKMSTSALAQLLRDFTPVNTASANLTGAGMFRKQHNSLLDLRGNTIDWGNRKIASKIRLLLCNNWIVKWDNDPPADIVYPGLYGFFVESTIETKPHSFV